MPLMGDKQRRLRRLSTKSIASASTALKDSPGTNDAKSEQTIVARKRRESKGSRHNGPKDTRSKTTEEPESTAENQSPQASKQNDVNVFAFMEKDQASNAADTDQSDSDVPVLSPSSSSSSSHSGSPLPPQLQSPYSDLEVHATENKEGMLWYGNYRRDHSLHSDSGISMLSTSPLGGSPESVFKKRLHRSEDGTPTTSHNGVMGGLITTSVPENPAARMSHIPSLDLHFMEEPESYYSSSRQPHPQTPHSATTEHHQAGLQPSSQPVVQQPSPDSIPVHPDAQAQDDKSNHDLLASAIDSRDDSSLMPIYRKFGTLNNRILHCLEEEISEMEEALSRLDAAITEEGGQVAPAMGPMHGYPSQSKWHRQELMSRIRAKVEQYNTALSSYSNLTKSLQPASQADMRVYQEWVTKHAPLAQQEPGFLQNGADLMTLSQPQPRRHLYPHDIPMIVVVVTLVSTIVVFRVVPSLLARLVISAVVGVASLCTLAPRVLTNIQELRKSTRMIWSYAAVMIVLAIVVG